MPELITRTPYVSPDTLRTALQLRRRFYETHTELSRGYTDLDGLQYAGTVQNFGVEMLIEARKMTMRKPPIASIKCNDAMSYYFDLQFADFIDTYDQQNMVMACLKPNTTLSNHEYVLKFTDVERVVVLRSEADGDEAIHPSFFYRTESNPTLMIDNVNVGLFVNGESNMDHHVVYYFADNSATSKFIDGSVTDETLLTVNLHGYAELPFIWLCTKNMVSLPAFNWTNNVDQNGKPLLMNGSNGQHVHQLYPYIYGDTNVPVATTGVWYIKAHGDFIDIETALDRNYSTRVDSIEFVEFAEDADIFTDQPITTVSLTYDFTFTKVVLHLLENGWSFHRPVEGDYDYDGVTYNNPVYAYIPLLFFEENGSATTEEDTVIPAFNVVFDDAYYAPYESQTNNMVSGAHVDFTTDYSDNSVIKNFGVIYGLNQFDGLPEYFTYFDDTFHRAHVELYAIRDNANSINQKATEKQTAAIIVDSSLPHNEIEEIAPSMASVIIYGSDRNYITDPDQIVSTINYASDIVFVDKHHFADRHVPRYADNQRFVYHGNRTFSLGITTLDPGLEYGRNYLVTNDVGSYENNAIARNPKAGRTAARICDIPTSFTQLEHIEGSSPTYVIDTKYVHQEAAFDEADYQRLWNDLQSRWYRLKVLRTYTPGGGVLNNPVEVIVYTPELSWFTNTFNPASIPTSVGFTVVPARYFELQPSIISHDVEYHVSIPGSGYAVDDNLGFNIGGQFFIGVVTAVIGADDGLDDFDIEVDPSIIPSTNDVISQIAFANLDGMATSFGLATRTGSGQDAQMVLDVSQELWDTSIRFCDGAVDSVFTLIKDDTIEGLYLLPYDEENDQWLTDQMVQITGYLNPGNPAYDTIINREYRTFPQVLLYNLLNYFKYEPESLIQFNEEPIADHTTHENAFAYPDYTVEKMLDRTDLGDIVNDFGYNRWNTFIAPVLNAAHTSTDVNVWTFNLNGFVEAENNLKFIKHNRMNVSNYDGSWSGLKFGRHNGRIIPYMYDIMHTTADTYVDESNKMRLLNRAEFDPTRFLNYTVPATDEPLFDRFGTLNFNLYWFNHVHRLYDLMNQEEELYQLHNESIQTMIAMSLGNQTITAVFDSYSEYEYVTGRIYTSDMLLVDRSTNKQYRTLQGFTASSIEQDLSNGYIEFLGYSTKRNDLVNYYLMTRYPSSVYDAPKLELYQQAGEQLEDGDKHIGAFVPVTETIEKNIYTDNIPYIDQYVYFFRMDNMELVDLQGFRMFDGDVDISEHCVLLINGREYIFHNNAWTWNYHA